MVAPLPIGSLVARATLLKSPVNYTDYTVTAIKALQTWYSADEGLWQTTGWWNSANCLTVLGDFFALDANEADDLDLSHVFANTFTQAQQTNQTVTKVLLRPTNPGLVESRYAKSAMSGDSDLAARGYPGFIDNYYDDEGWWALAWIRAYDVTGETKYLDMAESIFKDMQGGVDNVCGGGIWWNKDKQYKNAIANELYLSVAASLSNRAKASASYLKIAEEEWVWFKNSGMINDQNTINDGLVINSNGSCTNNGETVWSYNQGVVLGGLVELYKATGKKSYLSAACTIAEAAIDALSKDGILHDVCEDDGCGADGSQFKGVFTRNLHYLQLKAPQDAFRTFILDNANSIWNNDRNRSNYFGVDWAGPPSVGGGPNASTHSSATDTLVAAMAVL